MVKILFMSLILLSMTTNKIEIIDGCWEGELGGRHYKLNINPKTISIKVDDFDAQIYKLVRKKKVTYFKELDNEKLKVYLLNDGLKIGYLKDEDYRIIVIDLISIDFKRCK